ncbi:substrate-binding domain-containing protein [Ponticoccus sp. SC2-23]|uniref:sugar ABC transporter substrate-binding protein n=1 Tax=Alexandriicola marinus TaxID=2081710 RepID=UPI00193B3BFA|nr:substrate-binding domain-containing protein [Alexandriicola marinus]MBM1218675.1 substrate-binding domain-containing protein [Ponticoccus sp. SC6-9]MBM1224253.1 substrate-binding domain-containing protein [Ponticoccus sp. SC6-15]MBM1229968.1 substrate-binding domain-containing protein [Ponticoccus sp. SC6-38]MBM1233219.1 substrate-binding domain-containing protein [Ponticoccus sp. SC6-45]MBM1236831.1 substrate-binding domain-containing protein [Ponticoccus sp. SC6-49]MBM1242230.1 substrate
MISARMMLSALACSSAALLAGGAMAEPVEKWCEGVRIAAFPGGPQGGVFANNVYNGFRQAELDLGADVTYYFSNWDPNLMLQQIQQAVATGVDGIATYGFAGEDATGPIVQQAYEQGIIFTTLNTSLRDSQAAYGPNGFGYVGAPNYDAGYALGAEAAARAEVSEGDKVFVWGLRSQGGDRGQRTVGVIDAFEAAGLEVIYQEIDAATNANPNAGTATFVGLMGANPDVKIVVTDHGGLTSNVGVYADAAGLEPGDVYFAGFDMSPNTAQAVQEGYQNLVIDQQPYLQGYLPILNICLTEKYGFSGLDINTAGAFVDATNVDAVAPLAAVEIR